MTQTEILKYHFRRYPEMTPQDTVKLIYQSEFGCGHLIKDKKAAYAYLLRELEETARDESVPTVEPIGQDAVRVNLASLPTALSEETLFKIFCVSARMFSGSYKAFKKKLALVPFLIKEGAAHYTDGEYAEYLKRYLRVGGAVHHSREYNELYRPAYRVVHAKFAPYLDAFSRIDRMLASGAERFAVAIDGRCGSGKSTFAGLLARVYGCGIVHADDFYLPFDKRRGQLGGLDVERMSREIQPLKQSFTYQAFDPHTNTFTPSKKVRTSPFFVIEGSYSLGIDIGIPYGLCVFLTVREEEQLRRISLRSPDKLDDFRSKWIPAEERYFREYDVIVKSDIVVHTNEERLETTASDAKTFPAQGAQ